MDQFKSNVVEDIADLLVKLPFDPIADKNPFGEVDVQTRYYDPLLSSMVADTTKKIVLRWPNKEDTINTDICPDIIVSALVQGAFGQSVGFGNIISYCFPNLVKLSLFFMHLQKTDIALKSLQFQHASI